MEIDMKNHTEFKEKIKHGTEEFPVMIYNGGFIPYHWHPEYEIICMKSGMATYHINTDIFLLSEGDCCICKGGQFHSVMFEDSEPVVFDAIVFDLKFILKDIDVCNQFFSNEYLMNCKFSSKNEYERLIVHTIQEICEVFNKKAFGYELQVKMLFIKIFADIFKYGLYQRLPVALSQNSMEKTLMNVISHIHTFYNQKITIQSLADLTGYSVSHFGRFFKASTGKTPVEYIINYRLYRACDLLQNSDKSVLEVALECGFWNANYFIKTFKQKYGYTPYQYKQSH